MAEIKIGLGGTGAEGAPAKGNSILNVKAGPLNVQINNGGNDAFHGVNERMGKGSQTNPQNRVDNAVHNAGDNNNGNNFRTQNNNGNNGNNNYGANNNGNNGNHNGWGNGNNGNHNGWGNGNNGNNGNHNGWNHNNHGMQGPQHGQQGPQTNGNTEPTNPPLIPQTQTQTPNGKGNQTPPLQQTNGDGKQNPLPQTNGNGQGQGTNPPIIPNPGNQNQTPGQNFPQWNPPIIPTTRTYPNSPNNPVQTTIIQILRQNDIFISQSRINDLINNTNTNSNNNSTNIPNEVRNLVQSVVRELSNLTNSQTTNPQIIRQTASEISNGLQSQINSAREILIYTAQPDAKNFGNLNIQERVFLAVELMFNHLLSDTSLNQLSTREIYNGLLLARGMVLSGENTADIRNLISLRSDVLPNGFSATGLRDLGQLVKVLVVGAVGAKTTANLDAAVQKFIKILVAKNELGVLLAASMLGRQAKLGTISMNRTLALVQIYQLITRLILAGEAALKEAALKNASAKNENNLSSIGLNKITNAEEKSAVLRDLQNNNLHSNLKNFLEFNPAFAADRSASSFNNTEDARHAQQHFTHNHRDEIEQWLKSGNHRFVKEIDLDKPVGIVVERGADEFFSATKARVVLVRDSSAQGWHFLKSFLVT